MKVHQEPKQVALARVIATEAHGKQLDKIGQPYVGHPARVAAGVSTEVEKAAAWLHDVIEDTGVSAARLVDLGIEPQIVEAVELLTRSHDGTDEDYYAAIATHPVARAVKLSDIADNLQPWRTEQLQSGERDRLARKYAHACEVLGADMPENLWSLLAAEKEETR